MIYVIHMKREERESRIRRDAYEKGYADGKHAQLDDGEGNGSE